MPGYGLGLLQVMDDCLDNPGRMVTQRRAGAGMNINALVYRVP